MRRIRVGVVGCGEVAQAIHLPTLAFLRDLFTVTAVCDAVPAVADAVARRWGVPAGCTDPGELVARGDVDAVLVANPHAFHAETTLAAVAAGKHVLVEKPLCLGLAEARAVVAAAGTGGVVVQVGYMRRYAQTFTEARRLLEDGRPVRLVRVHAVLGRNRLILDQTHHVERGELPRALADEARARERALVSDTLGDDSPAALAAYLYLVTLNSHDFCVLRGLFGLPHGILYAARRGTDESPWLSAALDYGSFVCHFETGFDEIPRVDTHLEIHADDRVLRLEYDSPFVRNLPTRLRTTQRTAGGGVTEASAQLSWEDPFTSEWIAFHDAVTTGSAPRTTPADALEDLLLARDLVAALPAGET
ncbi:Gfo/Idh/MocA family oxidoreductase [soil metagenome]